MEQKNDKKTGRIIFIALAVVLIGYLLLKETDRVAAVFSFIFSLISPFLIGAAVAFIINVPLRAIEGKLLFVKKDKPRRIIAILLTMLVILELIAAVVLILLPQLRTTIAQIVEQLPEFFGNINDWIMARIEENPQVGEYLGIQEGEYGIDWMALIDKLMTVMDTSVESLVGKIFTLAGSAISGIYNAVFSIIFAFYCLTQKETLARQGRRLLYATFPEAVADETVRVLRMSNTVFSNFITGQCLEAVILGLMFVPVLAVFRIPYIPLICLVIAVTALVPMVGAYVGCVTGMVLILVDTPYKALVFLVIFLVVQQLENNLVYPRVVGQSIGLPGMWVLVAVSIGGSLMGVGGMLLMVPLASVLYALLREYAAKRLAKKNIDPEKLRFHPPELQRHFMFRRSAKRKARPEVSDTDQQEQAE